VQEKVQQPKALITHRSGQRRVDGGAAREGESIGLGAAVAGLVAAKGAALQRARAVAHSNRDSHARDRAVAAHRADRRGALRDEMERASVSAASGSVLHSAARSAKAYPQRVAEGHLQVAALALADKHRQAIGRAAEIGA
jgi:nitrite reductase/ring-hydroxylating ferredoxin subunit